MLSSLHSYLVIADKLLHVICSEATVHAWENSWYVVLQLSRPLSSEDVAVLLLHLSILNPSELVSTVSQWNYQTMDIYSLVVLIQPYMAIFIQWI